MVKGKHCCLSLRMMKAIWRHIRLKKGFVNIEPLSQGGHKLKIPQLLLQEKRRTQQRFNVRAAHPAQRVIQTLATCI